MSPRFPSLGTGLGFRPPYAAQFLEPQKPAHVDWLEVITENFIDTRDTPNTAAQNRLEKIRSRYPVVFHGVSLNVASTDALDSSYLKRVRSLCDRFQPTWVSDHLCFTGTEGQQFHDLLPFPYTKSALDHIAEKIDQVQNILARPLILENVSSYLQFKASEMTEGEFLGELSQRTGCGILLDINNLYVNLRNHGEDPHAFVDALPTQNIAQFHLAGHSDEGSFLVDTHDQPVREEVWALLASIIQQIGWRPAMIERDGNFPEWSELYAEVLRLKSYEPTQAMNTEAPHAFSL